MYYIYKESGYLILKDKKIKKNLLKQDKSNKVALNNITVVWDSSL